VSAAVLFAWPVGHGLRLEARSGMYERLVNAQNGRAIRLVNSIPVDEWPEHSLTAQQLDGLFEKFEGALHELNLERKNSQSDPENYRRFYRKITDKVKGE